jgi:hypothetical protein
VTPSLKTSIAGAAIALAAAGLGAAGTAGVAEAAVPTQTQAASSWLQRPPPPPPHRFRARFHSLAQCQAAARHDHGPRAAEWDCRRGRDHNNPWEYWGR